MMEAERLHREAALFSNELHTFRDEDIEGVKPLIDKIISKRKEWKSQMLKVKQYMETGKLPEEAVEEAVANSPALAQLKVDLQLLNQNISNRKKKIRDNPEHAKVESWMTELAMLEAHKADLKKQIVTKKYETA